MNIEISNFKIFDVDEFVNLLTQFAQDFIFDGELRKWKNQIEEQRIW